MFIFCQFRFKDIQRTDFYDFDQLAKSWFTWINDFSTIKCYQGSSHQVLFTKVLFFHRANPQSVTTRRHSRWQNWTFCEPDPELLTVIPKLYDSTEIHSFVDGSCQIKWCWATVFFPCFSWCAIIQHRGKRLICTANWSNHSWSHFTVSICKENYCFQWNSPSSPGGQLPRFGHEINPLKIVYGVCQGEGRSRGLLRSNFKRTEDRKACM